MYNIINITKMRKKMSKVIGSIPSCESTMLSIMTQQCEPLLRSRKRYRMNKTNNYLSE